MPFQKTAKWRIPQKPLKEKAFLSIARERLSGYNVSMNDMRKIYFGRTSLGAAHTWALSTPFLTARVTDLGASLVSLRVRTPAGRLKNTVLGYKNAALYEKGTSTVGATVGRYAGRIGGAAFTLDGKEYALEKNDGENHLHGGFMKSLWHAEAGEGRVRFALSSPDGDEGFPGALRVFCTYEAEGRTLRIVYEAEADAPTVLNLTNHSYFSLGGSAEEELLSVNAELYAELGPGSIPTGRLLPVSGTVFDLREPKRIGSFVDSPELSETSGLDHSFIINRSAPGLACAARLYDPETGLTLVCRTTRPTVHIYTANFLHLDAAGSFPRHGAVCMETQHLPDSPNKPDFPSTVLRPGEEYREETEYEFLTQ